MDNADGPNGPFPNYRLGWLSILTDKHSHFNFELLLSGLQHKHAYAAQEMNHTVLLKVLLWANKTSLPSSAARIHLLTRTTVFPPIKGAIESLLFFFFFYKNNSPPCSPENLIYG